MIQYKKDCCEIFSKYCFLEMANGVHLCNPFLFRLGPKHFTVTVLFTHAHTLTH